MGYNCCGMKTQLIMTQFNMTPEQYLEALLTLPGMWNPKVSPDGKWVAWTWYRAGPAADVYAAPTDGAAPPIRLTDSADDTILVSWTPDSRMVIVSQDHDGNERDQLFGVDLNHPLAMQPLTEANPNYYIRGGQLHPNGHRLVYSANFDVASGKEIEPFWVYRHDLSTGERAPLAKPEKGGWYLPDLNSTGTHILYTRMDLHPAGRQIWLVDIEGQEDRELFNFGADVKAFASWFPDGRRAVVLCETKTHRRLGVWDMTTGELRWLLDDPARNIENAYAPYGSDHIVVIEIEQSLTRASLLHPDTGDEMRLAAIPGNLTPLAPVGDGAWVGWYYSSRQPADLVRFWLSDLQFESFVSLSRVWKRTPLRPGDLIPAQDFRWKSVADPLQGMDGLEIHGWLYRPEGQARGVIVFVHGGPTSHSTDAINNQIQFFVRQGFTVLDPNYRGSTGYGVAFKEAIKADGWGGREQEDIRTGIEALIAAGIAERGKVGITGTSYGGYSSWCAITRFPPEVVAAAAPICGMTDLVVDYKTTRPDLRPYSAEMLGGTPAEVPEKYRERSPVHFVSHIKGRLLIVQGLQDPNVTPENVHAVTAALQDGGVEYELLAFEDEGHGISKPKNQKTLYLRLLEFFAGAFEA